MNRLSPIVGMLLMVSAGSGGATVVFGPRIGLDDIRGCKGGEAWISAQRSVTHLEPRDQQVRNPALRDLLLGSGGDAVQAAADSAAVAADAAAGTTEVVPVGSRLDAFAAADAAEAAGNTAPSSAQLEEFIAQHGVPHVADVGNYAMLHFLFMLDSRKVAPARRIELGERVLHARQAGLQHSLAHYAAGIVDEALIEQADSQRYGTQFDLEGDNDSRRVVPGQGGNDVAAIERARTEVGLVPFSLERCARKSSGSVGSWPVGF